MLIEYWLENKMTNNLLKNLIAATVIILTVGICDAFELENLFKINPNKLPLCPLPDYSKEIERASYFGWNNCWGKYEFQKNIESIGDILEGEWRNGALNGIGSYRSNGHRYYGDFTNFSKNGKGVQILPEGNFYAGDFRLNKKNGFGVFYFESGILKGSKYIGEYKKDNTIEGRGIFTYNNGTKEEGIFQDNKLLRKEIVNFSSQIVNLYSNIDINKLEMQRERQQLLEERKIFEEEKRSREQSRNNQRINIQINNTQPDANGEFNITIKTNADTASLKINGEEKGGRADGTYSIKKVARAGQETKFTIVAVDINGYTDSKTISVTRQVTASSQVKYAELNPALVKTQPNKDAVAIIIGIADYKNLPRADFANDDARAFYDYAIRGLGVRAENIKLLVDAEAGQEEIYKAFKTWLPARVRATTDVYVYYSGHGITTNDGQSLYLLPQRTDRDLIEETAIAQNKINASIQAAKPKSVTIFLDSCYSGAGRTGQTLLASARPISIKSTAQAFPAEFTVISASTAEQISSSSNELNHGIFSYYVMRGMEGDADTNKDGKITVGEMHSYLMDNVTRQASLANRVQQPQLSGDANRVLVGK